MKHALILPTFLALLLMACGGATDPETNTDDDWAAQDAAAAADEAAYMERMASDERPVNLACNEPGHRPGQADTYIGLHSFLYPAVAARGETLMQDIRDLRPRTTDPSEAERAAFEAAQQDAAMFAQFGFLATVDVQPRSLFIICSHELYDYDKCTQMARMMGDTLSLEDVTLDAQRLSFRSVMPGENLHVDMDIANPDFDGVTMRMTENGREIFVANWHRKSDGTERHNSSGEQGNITYIEKSDCSGRARWIRLMDNGLPRTMEFNWTSVREENFTLSYNDCKALDGGGQECTQGTF